MEQALEILKVSERLYAATMTDEQWPAALEAITDLFGGGHAIIQGFPGVDDDGAFIAAARVDNAVIGQTASSEAWRVVMRFERLVPAGISNRASLIDDRAFADSEIYNEIFRPMNGFHSLHVRQMQPHVPFALSVCWPRHATSFSYDKEALLRVLAPHAAMAVEIRNRLRSTQRRGDSLARMFDRLETGVIMTDAAAKPVWSMPGRQRSSTSRTGWSRCAAVSPPRRRQPPQGCARRSPRRRATTYWPGGGYASNGRPAARHCFSPYCRSGGSTRVSPAWRGRA